MRRSRTATIAIAGALLAACGGSGGDGGPTAVSATGTPATGGTGPAAPGASTAPPAAPSPAPAAGSAPAPAPLPGPAPGPAPAPGPTAAPAEGLVPGPGPAPVAIPGAADAPAGAAGDVVARRAVVRALEATHALRITSDTPGEWASDLRTSMRSGTTFSIDDATRSLDDRSRALSTFGVEVAVLRGEDDWTFASSALVRATRLGDPIAPQPETWSASQWRMPAAVRLDATLVRWTRADGGATLDFFVGSIADRPDRMRVCWHLQAPTLALVRCSRHLRADGSLTGADAIVDPRDRPRVQHASNDESARPRRVLDCFRRNTAPYEPVRETSFYEVFEWDPPFVVRRWSERFDMSNTYGGSVNVGSEATNTGATRWYSCNPVACTYVFARDRFVEGYNLFGGNSATTNTSCR